MFLSLHSFRLVLLPILIVSHGTFLPSSIDEGTQTTKRCEHRAIPISGMPAVRDYVRRAAQRMGVNPNHADWIVAHESRYGMHMRGDRGKSRGYWMISSLYHPEVTTLCADDLECSTQWALERIRAGFVNEWSAWRLRCQLYANAPECPPAAE